MIYAIVAVIVLILDQGLKYWTVSHIVLNTGEVPLIKGIIHLTNVHNYGAAFSILQNTRWLLVAMTAVFCIAVIYALSAEMIHTPLGRWSALLVMAGALGNGLDRLFIGYVVDMFEFEFFSFPVFNIADIFVTVCGILFCIYIVFHKNPYDGTEPKAEKRPLSRRMRHDRRSQEEERRGGDIEMIGKASVHRLHAQPDPRSQPRLKSKPFDAANPFAEWDGDMSVSPKATVKPSGVEPEYIAPEPDPVQKKASPSPAPGSSKSAANPENMEFDIDDILAEFKD
ncbi:MAG: signal peptidase II [Oscillospiraceae bacterium]